MEIKKPLPTEEQGSLTQTNKHKNYFLGVHHKYRIKINRREKFRLYFCDIFLFCLMALPLCLFGKASFRVVAWLQIKSVFKRHKSHFIGIRALAQLYFLQESIHL
jgi:hypothetical protein